MSSESFVWYRPQIQPKGPKSHALVVGVSHYDYLPPYRKSRLGLRQLDCAASAAQAFATWLKTSYRGIDAPLGSIRLLISPSQVEIPTLTVANARNPPAATADEFEAALYAWADECSKEAGSVALLYICGHGVLVAPGSVYVLLQDALKYPNLTNAFSVAPTQEALAVRKLRASLLFIDTCQQIQPDSTWNPTGGRFLVPKFAGTGDSRKTAPIFYASSPGSSAWGRPGRGTYFCEALLSCLKTRAVKSRDRMGSKWAVATDLLQQELPAAVQELRSDQQVQPAGWNRSHEVHQLDAPPVLPLRLSFNPNQLRHITRADLRRAEQLIAELALTTSPQEIEIPCGDYKLVLQSASGPCTFFLKHKPPKGCDEEIIPG